MGGSTELGARRPRFQYRLITKQLPYLTYTSPSHLWALVSPSLKLEKGCNPLKLFPSPSTLCSESLWKRKMSSQRKCKTQDWAGLGT